MQNNKNTVTQAAGQPDGSFTMRMENTTFIIGLHFKQDGKR